MSNEWIESWSRQFLFPIEALFAKAVKHLTRDAYWPGSGGINTNYTCLN
jgi:hypothetical protein